MRTIDTGEVTASIREMSIESNYHVDPAYVRKVEEAKAGETSSLGLMVLDQITENAALASAERVPYCQDTGVSIVFAEVGQDVHIEGGLLEDAINEGGSPGLSGRLFARLGGQRPASAREHQGQHARGHSLPRRRRATG